MFDVHVTNMFYHPHYHFFLTLTSYTYPPPSPLPLSLQLTSPFPHTPYTHTPIPPLITHLPHHCYYNTITLLYVPPSPYMSLLPPPLPPNNPPYVSLTNHLASYPTCGCCSLQASKDTALHWASKNGHTKIVLALLAAAGINVNHANVSIYPLTPSHVVVGDEGGGGLPPLPPHPNPRTN